MFISLLAAVLFLAYANGANDNFKGVATLFGSGNAGYRTALWWGCATTFAGSLASVFLARSIALRFSGQEIVSGAASLSPNVILSVALASALTVFLATVFGFPISTTHSLVGSLLGAGLMAAGSDLQLWALVRLFLAPLLLSPVLAVGLCYFASHLIRAAEALSGKWNEICLCAKDEEPEVEWAPPAAMSGMAGFAVRPVLAMTEECERSNARVFIRMPMSRLVDRAHYLSAGVVSFARGLNDTPKIAALFVTTTGLSPILGFGGVAVAMLAGGVLSARRVATRMSKEITTLTPEQGLAANVVTGMLVLFASRVGIPVSTTHVSVGALFGSGVANGRLNRRVLVQIGSAWLLTLPMAGGLAALLYAVIEAY